MKNHDIILSKVLIVFLVLLLPTAAMAQEEVINETTTINADEIKYYSFSGEEGVTITVSINVTSGGPIDILLLDSSNFQTYKNAFVSGSSTNFEYYVDGSALSVKSKTYEFTLPSSQTYYIVIENADFTSGGASPQGSVDVKIVVSTSQSAPGFELLLLLPTLIMMSMIVILKKRRPITI